MEGGKLILVLKTTVNQQTSSCGIKKNSSLRLLLLLLSCMVAKFGQLLQKIMEKDVANLETYYNLKS